MNIRDIVLNEMELKKTIKIMMAEANITSMASLARELGYKETTFRSAINNNSLRMVDFIKLSKIMGCEVVVREKQ